MARKQTSYERLPFNFSPQDVRRIREAIRPFFLGNTSRLSRPIGMKSTFERVELPFRPNKWCPPDAIFVSAPRRGFNLKHAENCINYLGFDQQFKEALLQFYRENMKTEMEARSLYGKTARAGAIRRLAMMFLALRGEKLRKILTPDDASAKRWDNLLREHGLKWTDIYIPAPTAAKVTTVLSKKLRNMGMSEKSLKTEFALHFRQSQKKR